MPRKPATQAPITSETMAYLHCWRAANEQGEFFIPCQNRSEAERIKFLLYRVIKQLLANPQIEREYPQFMRARRNCSCRAEQTPDGAGWQVCIYRSDKRREVRSLIERLGLRPEDLEIPASVSEQHILDKLGEQLGGGPGAAAGAGAAAGTGAAVRTCSDDLPAGMASYFLHEEE